jgi:hypothetical protein
MVVSSDNDEESETLSNIQVADKEDDSDDQAKKLLADISDSAEDSGPEDGPNRGGGGGMMEYDFDNMMAKRKAEQSRKRKRRDIDIINDNDDLIAQLIGEMRNAAEVRPIFCVFYFFINFVKNGVGFFFYNFRMIEIQIVKESLPLERQACLPMFCLN